MLRGSGSTGRILWAQTPYRHNRWHADIPAADWWHPGDEVDPRDPRFVRRAVRPGRLSGCVAAEPRLASPLHRPPCAALRRAGRPARSRSSHRTHRYATPPRCRGSGSLRGLFPEPFKSTGTRRWVGRPSADCPVRIPGAPFLGIMAGRRPRAARRHHRPRQALLAAAASSPTIAVFRGSDPTSASPRTVTTGIPPSPPPPVSRAVTRHQGSSSTRPPVSSRSTPRARCSRLRRPTRSDCETGGRDRMTRPCTFGSTCGEGEPRGKGSARPFP